MSVLSQKQLRRASRNRLTAALNCGALPPASDFTCSDCSNRATEYDHRDYMKPLEVEPVCHGCNQRRGDAEPPINSGPIDVPWHNRKRSTIAVKNQRLELRLSEQELKAIDLLVKKSGLRYRAELIVFCLQKEAKRQGIKL